VAGGGVDALRADVDGSREQARADGPGGEPGALAERERRDPRDVRRREGGAAVDLDARGVDGVGGDEVGAGGAEGRGGPVLARADREHAVGGRRRAQSALRALREVPVGEHLDPVGPVARLDRPDRDVVPPLRDASAEVLDGAVLGTGRPGDDDVLPVAAVPQQVDVVVRVGRRPVVPAGGYLHATAEPLAVREVVAVGLAVESDPLAVPVARVVPGGVVAGPVASAVVARGGDEEGLVGGLGRHRGDLAGAVAGLGVVAAGVDDHVRAAVAQPPHRPAVLLGGRRVSDGGEVEACVGGRVGDDARDGRPVAPVVVPVERAVGPEAVRDVRVTHPEVGVDHADGDVLAGDVGLVEAVGADRGDPGRDAVGAGRVVDAGDADRPDPRVLREPGNGRQRGRSLDVLLALAGVGAVDLEAGRGRDVARLLDGQYHADVALD